MKVVLLLLLSILFPAQANAEMETSRRFGDYEVHFVVFNTSFVSPEVAKAYGFVRAKDRALLNIALRHKPTGGEDRAAPALIEGKVFDLIHRRELKFQEIREDQSIYYLAPVDISGDNELMEFDLTIRTDRDHAGFKLKFQHRLFKN